MYKLYFIKKLNIFAWSPSEEKVRWKFKFDLEENDPIFEIDFLRYGLDPAAVSKEDEDIVDLTWDAKSRLGLNQKNRSLYKITIYSEDGPECDRVEYAAADSKMQVICFFRDDLQSGPFDVEKVVTIESVPEADLWDAWDI